MRIWMEIGFCFGRKCVWGRERKKERKKRGVVKGCGSACEEGRERKKERSAGIGPPGQPTRPQTGAQRPGGRESPMKLLSYFLRDFTFFCFPLSLIFFFNTVLKGPHTHRRVRVHIYINFWHRGTHYLNRHKYTHTHTHTLTNTHEHKSKLRKKKWKIFKRNEKNCSLKTKNWKKIQFNSRLMPAADIP